MKKQKTALINTTNDWFDTENARLIILCAVLGIFGVHKFVQRKTGQGIVFLLLDLTIFGLVVSFVWAFLDLVFLTAKTNNKPLNMFFGTFLIFANISIPFVSGADVLVKTSTKDVKAEQIVFEENVECEKEFSDDLPVSVSIKATADKAKIFAYDKVIELPGKIYSEKLKVYEGFFDWNLNMNFIDSTKKDDKVTLVLRGNKIELHTKFPDAGFSEYRCTIIKD